MSRVRALNKVFDQWQSAEYDSEKPKYLPIEWFFKKIKNGLVLDVSEMEGSGGGTYVLYKVTDGVGTVENKDYKLTEEAYSDLDILKDTMGVYWR